MKSDLLPALRGESSARAGRFRATFFSFDPAKSSASLSPYGDYR